MKNVTCSVLMAVVSSSSLLAQPTLVASPSSGELGSIIQLSVVPQTPGFELTSETTGVWFGSYSSTAGTSSLFTTTYNGTTISIIDDWTAEILLGTGDHVSKTGPIEFADLSSLAPNGTLNGAFQLITPNPCQADLDGSGDVNFSDISAFLIAYSNEDPVADFSGDGLFNFSDVSAFLISYGQGCGPVSIVTEGAISMGFTVEPAEWHMVYYPGGWALGLDPEFVESSPTEMGIFQVSTVPGVIYDDSLLGATGMIYGVTLDVENNATTASGNPATILVDVFTVDSSNIEIDRISGLSLANEGVVDGRVRFSSRLFENVILTDTNIDDSAITSLKTLHAVDGGMTFVVLNIGD